MQEKLKKFKDSWLKIKEKEKIGSGLLNETINDSFQLLTGQFGKDHIEKIQQIFQIYDEVELQLLHQSAEETPEFQKD